MNPLPILLIAILGAVGADGAEDLLREAVARTAIAQAHAMDPAWIAEQRDCAGLVRFAYRSAYQRLAPERLARPLWRDRRGAPAAFADAETLIEGSFRRLGRGSAEAAELKSGDLLAFRQDQGADAEPVHHLMIVVKSEALFVVYHPGSKDGAVRMGRLSELARKAPFEWRPVAENPAFLGFYRFEEWMR
jgi:uncharacterized protein YfaT (DUF1175 family)